MRISLTMVMFRANIHQKKNATKLKTLLITKGF